MSAERSPWTTGGWVGSLRQQHRELFKLATAQPVLPKSITAGFNLARFQTILNLAFLPPNLRPLHEQIDAFDAMEIMGSEGIPLSPVPRADIALELLEAGSRAARREVLAAHAMDIATDCESVLAGLDVEGLRGEWRDFAHDGFESLRAGNLVAAQALFSVLATTLVDHLDLGENTAWRAARRSKVSKAERHELDSPPNALEELPGWEFWVAAPLWHAYPSTDRGEELADRWARNASVHSASRVHYNAPNTVVSMMFVTMMLDFIALAPEPD